MATNDAGWKAKGADCLLIRNSGAIRAADWVERRATKRGDLPHHLADRYCRVAYESGDDARHLFWAETYGILCARYRCRKLGGTLFLVIDSQESLPF